MEEDKVVRFNNTFPPGFRFHPSDEELIVHYLKKKINSHPLPAPIVAEINLYKFNPWDLPACFVTVHADKALFGEDEWYFFSPRDRKYPNGLRPNRATPSGYWKATGSDKPVLSRPGSKLIGSKKALVFYSGRPPKGTKTDWIMNEYRLVDNTIRKPSRFKGSMRLDDWVLCRVRYKDYSSNNRGGEIQEKCASKLNLPTITDYHQMLASVVLDDEPNKLPCDNMSGMNFRSSKGNSFCPVSPQMTTIPSLDNFSCFDSLKRVSNEDSQRGLNLISFNSGKPNPENYKIDNVTDTNCYSHSVCDDGSLGQRIVDSGIHFQELNELPFTGRFMQWRND